MAMTEEKSLQIQVSELTQKVDLLLEYISEQRLNSNRMDDLVSDLSIVGKDFYDSAVEELDNRMIEFDPSALKCLTLRLLRNIENINKALVGFESIADFLKDAGPIVNEVVLDFSKRLNKLDQKGYFEFFAEFPAIFDNIVTHFTPQDVRAFADNIVSIVETAKSMTQPDMVKSIQNGLKVYRSIETENIPEYSLFKAIRELNKPEMKKAIGFLISFMKNISQQNNN